MQVVTQIQNWGKDSSNNTLQGATTTYNYQLAITGTGCPAAGSDTDCVGDTWLPASDNNWQAYYDGQFRGFASVMITSPSGDLTVQHYSSNHGWGSAATDPVNYLSSNLLDEEVYSGNSTSGPLLEQTTNTYGGESGTNTAISCDTSVTGTYIPCAVVLLSTRTTTDEGMYGIGAPWVEHDYTYDDYTSAGGLQIGPGHYHNTLTQVTNGSNLSSAIYPLTQKWTYATNDQIVNGWTYYDVNKLSSSQTVDKSGHIWGCQATRYDEGVASGVPAPAAGFVTTATTYSSANCANQTNPLTTTYTGYDGSSQVATVDALGAANPNVYSGHGCTLATAPAIISSAWSGGHYTSCTTYDSFDAQPTTQINALGQTSTTTYDTSQQDLPVGVTDPNSQVTTATYSYDSNGNQTGQLKQPLETGSYTSRLTAYSTCATTLPSSTTLPCFDEEKNISLYSSAVSHTFYDAQGRAVETRTPGPTPSDDTVVMTVYNDQNNSVWKSVPFQVADGAGWIDPNGAKDINGIAPAGTTTFSDALGRTIATKDPNFGSSQEPGISCSATLSGNYTACVNYSLGNAENDPGIYATASAIDANNHLSVSYSDALGQTRFTQQYSGLGAVQSSNALMYSGMDNSATSSFAYMKVFDLSSQNVTIGSTTTLSYWIYPQSNASSGAVNGNNSTCVAIDMIFTDGSDLRDSGAVDQHGNQLHPSAQCNHLTLDQWNLVTSDIGAKVNGKTINRIDVGYDQPPNVGGYRGYIDDISLANPGSSTPLFATDFESGSPQPTWGNTPDNASAVQNVGGICCGLTGPEMGTRQEISHMNAGRVVKQMATQYNVLGKPITVTVTDERPQNGETSTAVTTTMTYDDLGRMLTENDPDQGNFSSIYDPNGHVLSVTQTSGSNTRTLGFNYDLLGRVGCEQTAAPIINATGACSAGSPLLQNTYDKTFLGTQGSTDFPIGQLTQSIATTYYPGGTSATVTEQAQHDQRGRALNTKAQLGLPSGWSIGVLPTYQASILYNDANQLTTTTTLAGSAGYTFTNVYDPTNGAQQGLSNSSSSTANLATLAYNEYGQLGSITQLNGAASSPTNIASETFNYDGNLRPTTLTANWLPGSGNNGEIMGQGRSYDNASNVTSTNAFFAAVPGKSGSGGSETQNFCYNEQNQLVWSGNGGTQPGAGNGTCGSGQLSSGLSGAGYTAPFTYTNLGQLWQGPVNGQGLAQQYLYCNSAPHQLTGIYPTGTTCANKGSAVASYSASYDPWGNETSRMANNVTSTLTYDALNRLTTYSTSLAQEQYVYDASGTRIFKRSTSAGKTTLAVYPNNGEEYDYTSNGTLTSQLHYYALAGHLIGEFDGTKTTYYLTDPQSSLLTSFSQSAVQGEQVYGPYGNQRYTAGTINTAKGYTGQIHDAVSGMDYYNARFYDPVSGQFLSADNVQGNAQGADPYSYVAGNPETMTDPTGQKVTCGPEGCGGGGGGSNPPPPTNPCVLSGGNPLYCGGEGGGGGPSGPPPSPGCHGGCKVVPPNNPSTGTGNCHPGASASASCNDWYVKHAKPAQDSRLAALDTSGTRWQLVSYILAGLADIILLISITDPIKWLQLAIEWGSFFGRQIAPSIGKLLGGSIYQTTLALAAGIARFVGVAEGLLAALRAGSLLAKFTVVSFIYGSMFVMGPAEVSLRVVLTILGPLVGGLLDVGANFAWARAQDDFQEEAHERGMDIISWCAQYGNGACGTPPSN